jgi:hypothetical protein
MNGCSTRPRRQIPRRLLAALVVTLLGTGCATAVAATPAAVRDQLRRLHLRPAPLYPPKLPSEFHGASATLDNQARDFEVSFVRVRAGVSNLAVTLRRAGPAFLDQVIHDPRRPQIGQTQLRGLKVYSFTGNTSFGYAWHEQGRTYQLLSKYYSERVSFHTLAAIIRSLRVLR